MNKPIPTSISLFGPPIPKYVFRTHDHSIHAIQFFSFAANGQTPATEYVEKYDTHFASGDSSGLVVIWSLLTKRPVMKWQAHDGGILGIKEWPRGPAHESSEKDDIKKARKMRLITHGRDHTLRIWQLTKDDFTSNSETGSNDSPVSGKSDQNSTTEEGESAFAWRPRLLHAMPVSSLNFAAFAICPDRDHTAGSDISSDESLPTFIAAPNGLDQGGVDIFHLPTEKRLSKIKGDENVKTGMAMTLRLFFHARLDEKGDHRTYYLQLAAGYEDGRVVVFTRQNLKDNNGQWKWDKTLWCKAHSQPLLSLDVHPDHSFLLTSGADATISKIEIPNPIQGRIGQVRASQINNTKHAGQQDLKIRTDGKIFATAGWDRAIRVYSCKTLKEVAVLKWHTDGCYATAFARFPAAGSVGESSPFKHIRNTNTSKTQQATPGDSTMDSFERQATTRLSPLDQAHFERELQVLRTHWLLAGSKDGKISLWDIY